MNLVATGQIDRFPTDISMVGDNVVLLTSHKGETVFDAYDADLSPVWSKRVQGTAVAMFTAKHSPWVLDCDGAWAMGPGGDCLARVKAPLRQDMRVSAVGSIDDGFVFAWQHESRAPMRPPTLERRDHDGSLRWSTTLTVDLISYSGLMQMRADDGWIARPKDDWTPRTWYSTSPTLTVSGDAVLACFSDMPSSGIGLGYVISLMDGSLRYTTKTGPISSVASMGDGAFIVGYQGYGAFETLWYDREGRVVELWASHGHYLVANDVRVIELENRLPSKMHLARLLPGGGVDKGEWLDGYYSSRPFLGLDGTAYFFRKGSILAMRDLSIVERLVLMDPDDGLFSTDIAGDERSIYLAYTKAYGKKGATLAHVAPL